MAEEQRPQELRQEGNLHNALESMGISDKGLDHHRPETAEEFKEFGSVLIAGLSNLKESPHFTKMISELVTNVCANCKFYLTHSITFVLIILL